MGFFSNVLVCLSLCQLIYHGEYNFDFSCCLLTFFLFQAQNVNLTLMSAAQLPARMEPLARTSLVITSASVWLRLKVMSAEGTCDIMGEKKKL